MDLSTFGGCIPLKGIDYLLLFLCTLVFLTCVLYINMKLNMFRYMKTLKAYVKNYARPEACIAEGYLAGECIAFCLEFLQNSVPVEETLKRNEDVEPDEFILEGRPLGKPIEVTLLEKERDIAHRYVLLNTSIMEPYLA